MMSDVDRREEILKIAEVLKAMGHPIRLRIMLELTGTCRYVRDIWEKLQLPQAVISQHLKILKDHGALEARREGAKVCYLITNSMIRDIVRTLEKNV